jgi:uncharacterized membrane protein
MITAPATPRAAHELPDVLDKYGVIHIPSWLTMGSIDDARAILSAMMGAVATVLALIFSVALLVLSMVATLFGPRLLYRFLQDWVTQVTIGLFMGTFVYICLVFLVTHQDSRSAFIPQVSLIASWALVVFSFGFLVYYSHRVASSIQNSDMIGAVVSCAKSGYLQHVDHSALVAAARAADALIVLRFRPGQFVLRGEPLAAIVPPGNAHGLEAAVDRQRSNDTFTGVACVDWLADALLTLAERPPLAGNWYDTGSTLRVWMPPVRLERLVKLAFDQIRQASVTTPAVLIRQLDAIRRLAPRLPDACRQKLSEQADAIRESASAHRVGISSRAAMIWSVQLQTEPRASASGFGCGYAALWGRQSCLQPPFQAARLPG